MKKVSDNIPDSVHDSNFYAEKYPKPIHNFKFMLVTVENMFKTINSLNNSKYLDIYGLTSSIMKICATYISEVLTHLFNECLIKGCVFPDQLKNIKVIPIHKKGDIKAENNYRPISIVPIVSKIFESLLQKQISEHFERCGIFTDKQYGYRPKRSTCNAVVKLVNNVVSDLENGNNVTFRSYDMSKAFDTVQHSILSKKLSFYGFHSDSTDLILSYLTNRTQFVLKDGIFSEGKKVVYGVPQGSILGPILFNIYINDLPKCIESVGIDGFLFADDVGLKISDLSKAAVTNKLDSSITLLQDWCAANNLSLNTEKICDLSFSYSRTVFDSSEKSNLRFLGMMLDSRLSWNYHVDFVSKKMA